MTYSTFTDLRYLSFKGVNMKKQFLAAGLAATIGIAGVGAGVVNAAADTSKTDPTSSLVDKIATKFNLNKSDVQAVFDEQKTTRDAARETEIKAAVTQLVTDGKLSLAQADAINAKRADLQKDHEANRATMDGLSPEARKEKMETKRSELESWAKSQGIPTEYLRYVVGHGGPGMRHGHDRGDDMTKTNE